MKGARFPRFSSQLTSQVGLSDLGFVRIRYKALQMLTFYVTLVLAKSGPRNSDLLTVVDKVHNPIT